MPKSFPFWRNVTLIGLAHVVAIVGLIRWGRETARPETQGIVWMSGAGGDGAAAIKPKPSVAPKPVKIAPPPPPKSIHKEPPRYEEPPLQPFLASVPSEIQLPSPAPKPTSGPDEIPKAIPVAKATPKPSPKPTPKPTPRPTPKKIILAKASPKPSPKVVSTPEKKESQDKERESARATPIPTESPNSELSEKPSTTVTANVGLGKGTSTGAGGHAGGGAGESQFGWYGSMLHDRFYSEWSQPTSVVPSGVKLAVLVKLRIEKDGRVSKFEIIRPSNNVIVDESVAAAAKRVTQVDPLPPGLGNGEHYDVKINFELNSE